MARIQGRDLEQNAKQAPYRGLECVYVINTEQARSAGIGEQDEKDALRIFVASCSRHSGILSERFKEGMKQGRKGGRKDQSPPPFNPNSFIRTGPCSESQCRPPGWGRVCPGYSCLPSPSQLAVRRAGQRQGRGAAPAARHEDGLLHDPRE